MAKFVEIGGQRRPIAFGMEAFYLYELETGLAMDDLIQRVMRAGIEETQNPGTVKTGIADVVEIIYWGLRTGSELQNEPFTHSRLEVAGWFNSDMDALPAIMQMLGESLPRPSESQKKTAPKPNPPRKRVGTK